MKPVKATKTDLKTQVDELGTKYEDTKENLTVLNNELSDIKDKIKDLAKKYGKQESRSIVVRGSTYAVGYTSVEESLQFDPELAAKVLPESILRLVLTEQVDETKFAALVNKGVINKKTVEACCKKRKGYERTVVTTVDKLDEFLREASNGAGE